MSTFYGASDLQGLLDEFGVPVTVGAITANGIRDQEDERLLEGELAFLVGKLTTVVVVTSTFAGLLVNGAPILVDAVTYKIHSAFQIEDGAYTRVRCVLVT